METHVSGKHRRHTNNVTAGSTSLPDIGSIPHDLETPPMSEGTPAPGRRVRQTTVEYQGTGIYHALYLPADWRASGLHPVIVEYAGNGPYRNAYGDVCTGRVEDCNLGYGISGGERFIWACLPYLSADGKRNQLQWWGDLRATVDYCKTVVAGICSQYCGDPSAIFIAGFSRGAIACNYLGLHDDEIAELWLGFVAHSHYDGVRAWGCPGSDTHSAVDRLARLRGRPQFISHEGSVEETRRFLEGTGVDGAFTFQAIPYRNHTDTWVLCDIPERRVLRRWMQNVLDQRSLSGGVSLPASSEITRK
jgi:hypothetical protein